MRHSASFWACLLASTVTFIARQTYADSGQVAPEVPSSDVETKALATAHFEKGLALFDAGAWDTALTEFLEARRLHPLRNAVTNAAICLEKLHRYDEALAKIEDLLREFGDKMSPEAREKAQRKLIELRGLVGVIEIDAAEFGARILVDGRARGEYPLLSPLRVPSGSHIVRVVKPGFEPFEEPVDVAGGRTVRIEAKLSALTSSGRLRVVEQRGRSMAVLVDGNEVGATPWEGQLPVGEHVVVLRGDGDLGTQPVSVQIELDRTWPLTLAAEELSAALRIEPSPLNASVAIDSIAVGRGLWEGRLRVGSHWVEVAAPGFLPSVQQVTIKRAEQKTVTIVLERDPTSLFAPRRGHVWFEAKQTALLVPGFGGDIGDGQGAGGNLDVAAAYQWPTGFSLGLSVGAYRAWSSVRGRTANAHPVDLREVPDRTPLQLKLDDTIMLYGLRAGADIGFSFGVRVPLLLHIGAGGFFGTSTDYRSSGSTDVSGVLVGATSETRPMRGFYVAPDIRIGWALDSRWTLMTGVGLLVLLTMDPPVWDADGSHQAALRDAKGRLAYAIFEPERFGDRVMVSFTPSIGVRHHF